MYLFDVLFLRWRKSPFHLLHMGVIMLTVLLLRKKVPVHTPEAQLVELERICFQARQATRKRLGELAQQGRLVASMKDPKYLVGNLAINELSEWYIPQRISWAMINRWVMEYAPAYIEAQQRQKLNQADS